LAIQEDLHGLVVGPDFGGGHALGQSSLLGRVEFATLEWVDWFNTRRLLEPIGYVPPAEYEARYYEAQAKVA
jgi:hypothetical protein